MLRRALAQRQQATKCGFTSRETQATARQLAALLDKEKRPADADDIRAQAGLTLPAGVKVFVGHNDVAHATHDFKLSGMPPLTPNALSANSRLSIIDGSADGNSGPLDVLHDGKLANSADDPANNFFFGTDVNRLTADLGAVTDLKEINTYSWHTAERAPQVYTLYASDGAAPGFNPRPKNGTDPTSFGWKLLAVADTHHQFKDEAGQYGVSISGANGSLGKYRYLLFVIRKGTPDNVDGNTFYSEINIVPVNPQPPVAGQQR